MKDLAVILLRAGLGRQGLLDSFQPVIHFGQGLFDLPQPIEHLGSRGSACCGRRLPWCRPGIRVGVGVPQAVKGPLDDVREVHREIGSPQHGLERRNR